MFQITHVSMFPKRSSPASARSRAPETLSRIHAIFGPEKYVAIGRPVFSRKRSCPPSEESSLQIWSVRVSCQTIALWTGLPVDRSQTIVVSRWFVTPTAEMSPAEAPAFFSPASITSSVRKVISIGSCSTQPGLG